MMPKHIDAHAHLNFQSYRDDYHEVIDRAFKAGVWMINVGTQYDTSKRAVEIAEEYDKGMYAIVGLHPVHTTKSFHDAKEVGEEGDEFTSHEEVFDIDRYRKLVEHPKVVGIGECGLDYYRTTETSVQAQRNAFIAQIELAIEQGVPLMLHVRPSDGSMDAYYDVLTILESYHQKYGVALKGNVHFFAGDTDVLRRFLDIGFTASFTGVITFARMYEQLIKYAPLDRILVETDCPYVTPHPYRGRRNEPHYVGYTAAKVARILKMDEEEVAGRLVMNTRRLFKI